MSAKTTTEKAPTGRATNPVPAAFDHTFGQLARGVGRYLAELDGFAAGDFGPLPSEVARAVRAMADNARDELLNLTLIHGRG